MKPKLPFFKKFGQPTIHFQKQEKNKKGREFAFFFIIIIAFLTLFARVFHLTIVKGVYFQHIAQSNRVKEVSIPAPRGTIKDRKSFTIAYSENLTTDDKKLRRTYNAPEALAHVIGYAQIANKYNINFDDCTYPIKLNESIGKLGAEKKYECQLRGIRGKELIEIDASGKKQTLLSKIEPVEGKTVQMAIDIELQKKIYDILTLSTIENSGGKVVLKEKNAAVIAINPKTAEILAMVSTPSFDPHVFLQNQQSQVEAIMKDKRKPMLNRALNGTYPPGSVFKIVIATGALEDGIVDKDFEIEDKGVIEAGPLKFGNWYFLQYGKTDGKVNMVKAIKRSNDIFFYKVGEKMGEKNIRKWASTFGFGNKTGIGIQEEAGLIPSSFWKQETIGERWFLGDTYNFSIGQGYLLTTPMQIAMMTSVFANNGYLCTPQLDKNKNSNPLEKFCKKLPISKDTLNTVKEGMLQTCESGGTGWPFFGFRVEKNSGDRLIPEIITGTDKTDGQADTDKLRRIKVGCKTGTAESHGTDTLPHAWFTVFAPFDDPEIVLTVMVEEAGEGSNVAAPIAKQILRSYFERNE